MVAPLETGTPVPFTDTTRPELLRPATLPLKLYVGGGPPELELELELEVEPELELVLEVEPELELELEGEPELELELEVEPELELVLEVEPELELVLEVEPELELVLELAGVELPPPPQAPRVNKHSEIGNSARASARIATKLVTVWSLLCLAKPSELGLIR